MIVVHDTFVCKPGNASKMAKLFKEVMGGNEKEERKQIAVMTDMTGQYHRVIMASWYESLSAYEEKMKAMENPTPEQKAQWEKMGNMQDMYTSGSREIYKVW